MVSQRGWRSRRVTGAGLVASIRPSIIALTGRTKGNSTTRPPDKRQTLLGLARRRAAITLDGAALFVIDANCHGPLSRDDFAAPCHLAQQGHS